MRVLYVTSAYPFGDTAEAFLEPEVRHLVAQGVELDVLPMRRSGDPRELPHGVSLRPETLAGSAAPALRSAIRRPRDVATVLRLLAGSPRFIARNGAVTPAALAVAAQLEHERPYDHIHAHWLTHTSTFAMLLSSLTGVPFSITAHRWDVYEENLFPAKASRAAFIRFIARACREAFEQRTGPSGGRLVDLHMGVDVTELPTSAGAPPSVVRPTLRLVAVGSLSPVKGQQHLIEAVHALRAAGASVSLDILGEGPEHERLTALVHALGLEDSVHLQGTLPRAEVLARYAEDAYDIFVMPSVDLGGGVHEGIPVALMEAMSAQVPVVATDTGGIPELVIDKVTGRLVAHQSSTALAEAISWVAADAERAHEMARRGAEHVREEFDAARVSRRLIELMRA